jgi:hypothetical protein
MILSAHFSSLLHEDVMLKWQLTDGSTYYQNTLTHFSLLVSQSSNNSTFAHLQSLNAEIKNFKTVIFLGHGIFYIS